MTTEPNRLLTPISTKAHQHMKKIVAAYKKHGLPESNTHWLSELILSQQIPNGHAKPAPVAEPVTVNEEGQ